MTNNNPGVKIKARKRTRCSCGAWVAPGYSIRWDPETRRTTGCPSCLYTDEHPDPWADADDDPWLDVL